MLQALALVLVLAPEKTVLSPEAAEHNRKAMVFYDAGQLAAAVDEFLAAYASMPDPRLHREGRRQLVGSMSMTLRGLHEIIHEAAPLCRLQAILQTHAEALVLAYPDDPDTSELDSVHWHHEEVTRMLAAYGPDACKPPAPTPAPAPAPVAAPPPALERVAPAPSPRPAPPDEIPPRQLKIAGGVTLGLGAALLGGAVFGIVVQHQQRARAREFDARQPDPYITRPESDELQGYLARAQFGRRLAVGTGLAAGVMTAMGTALLVLAHRSPRARRWSAAPWWSTAGAGLTVHVQLGSSR